MPVSKLGAGPQPAPSPAEGPLSRCAAGRRFAWRGSQGALEAQHCCRGSQRPPARLTVEGHPNAAKAGELNIDHIPCLDSHRGPQRAGQHNITG